MAKAGAVVKIPPPGDTVDVSDVSLSGNAAIRGDAEPHTATDDKAE